jgi:nicotinamidase-related amidase
MLLDAERSQLLIVDVQDKLLPAMHQGDAMVEHCAVLLQAAQEVGVPAVISEQYRKGLGATVPRLDNAKGNAPVMEKMHFSCAADPAMAKYVHDLAATGRRQLVIGGIESHVCVLQSALQFQAQGLDVFVVGDAVTSRRPDSVSFAFERMRGAGVQVVNTEMTLFEWLHVAGTPVFKTVSKLIK